jgi:hypothetical protein
MRLEVLTVGGGVVLALVLTLLLMWLVTRRAGNP